MSDAKFDTLSIPEHNAQYITDAKNSKVFYEQGSAVLIEGIKKSMKSKLSAFLEEFIRQIRSQNINEAAKAKQVLRDMVERFTIIDDGEFWSKLVKGLEMTMDPQVLKLIGDLNRFDISKINNPAVLRCFALYILNDLDNIEYPFWLLSKNIQENTQ